MHPEFAVARAGLSEALWQIYHRDLDPELLEQAEEQARLALEQDPDLPAAHVALARVLREHRSGRRPRSKSLEEALAIIPTQTRPTESWPTSYERIGELEEAESYLQDGDRAQRERIG